MKNSKLGLIASLAFATGIHAGTQELGSLSKADAKLNVAQAQNVFVIKKSDAQDRTRISLVVKDLGGSTDVSPALGLYLTFWQDGEMQNSTAAFELGNTWSVVDYNDRTPGKIVFQLKQYGAHGFYTERVTVDYAEFAKHFNREAAIVDEDFVDKWVQGSIYSKTAQ